MSAISLVLILNLIFISPGNCRFQQSSSSRSDKVRLTDVSTITLHSNQSTTGRRSSPVPQLKCVGGTANCCDGLLETVQCYNKGSDGNDVQWECKAKMDNAYQFGSMQVTCEGYEYPDDPYVLKGSCGLEYELDLTWAGRFSVKTVISQMCCHIYSQIYSEIYAFYTVYTYASVRNIIILLILLVGASVFYKYCIDSDKSYDSSSYQFASSGTPISSVGTAISRSVTFHSGGSRITSGFGGTSRR